MSEIGQPQKEALTSLIKAQQLLIKRQNEVKTLRQQVENLTTMAAQSLKGWSGSTVIFKRGSQLFSIDRNGIKGITVTPTTIIS